MSPTEPPMKTTMATVRANFSGHMVPCKYIRFILGRPTESRRFAPIILRATRGQPSNHGLPQSSIAWLFDGGVIWSEGPNQAAELGSPTAIGNFRDTDRLDSFSARLA